MSDQLVHPAPATDSDLDPDLEIPHDLSGLVEIEGDSVESLRQVPGKAVEAPDDEEIGFGMPF